VNLRAVPAANPNNDTPHVARANDSERIVLGTLMRRGYDNDNTLATCQPKMFWQPLHERIARAIAALTEDGHPTDPVAVKAQLERDAQQPLPVSDATYLADLLHAVPANAMISYHAARVVRAHKLRASSHVGQRIINNARLTNIDTDEDVDKILDAAADEITAVINGTTTSQLTTAAEHLTDTLDRIEHGEDTSTHIRTGITDLDAMFSGLRPGQLILIGARPGIGKTVFGLGIARHAAIIDRVPTLFASLEMSIPELMLRLMAAEAKVPLHHLLAAKVDADAWPRLGNATARIAAAPLYLDDHAALGLGDIRRLLRSMRRTQPARLLIVDYLQLMATDKAENRQVAVAALSRGLKLIAKEFDIPVVVLAQLNRGPEQRSDKTPLMSDLRESGSLEADADKVILLHRPDAYDRESPRSGEMDLIVPKNRNGPQCTITVAFQGHYARAVDMADVSWGPQ
jgi:replicative DNA helicase